ncbi:MAG: acetyltransferase [Magnetococcales bacterium]|nr:acetyltransferase [Magnetococcales bacterium]
MAPLIPPGIRGGADALAIVDWQEGGAGQVHSWIEAQGYRVACFVHADDTPPVVDVAAARKSREAKIFDYPLPGSYKGIPLVSARAWPEVIIAHGIHKALILMPDPHARFDNIALARQHGLELIRAIHPTALVMADAVIHENVVLHARAFIGYRSEIHPGVVVNSGASLDHHNVAHPCARIDPGVVTAGNVTFGRFATVHTGAVIINRIRIGEGAIVGAGAVIIRDVPPGATVVGNPGRLLPP